MLEASTTKKETDIEMTKAEREEKLRQRLAEMKKYEDSLHAQGITFIAGVDEVGRGPLAGPVTAAAVVLPADFDVLGVDDSKKLSEKKREELYDIIKGKALAYGLGFVDNKKIDEINILEATKLAMKAALEECGRMLQERAAELSGVQKAMGAMGADPKAGLSEAGSPHIEHVLIDALTLRDVDIPQTGIIKGDASSVSIAAASIMAKVSRDRLMAEYHEKYPQYGFDKNKGYGTKAHYEGIASAGICPIHRKTFLKNVL